MTNQFPGISFPRMTVGVMGSAGGTIPSEVIERCYKLGQEIAKRGCIMVTGACPGLPHEAVRGAKSEGGTVIGISPGHNLREHVEQYNSPTDGYDVIIYTGSGLMGREIENIRTCDFVIIAGGRSGTLGEFAIAYDESKVIGVLEDTGGIASRISQIVEFIDKETGTVICYDRDPAGLLDQLVAIYQTRLLPEYLEIIAGGNPDGALES